jgi:hypothetical protein
MQLEQRIDSTTTNIVLGRSLSPLIVLLDYVETDHILLIVVLLSLTDPMGIYQPTSGSTIGHNKNLELKFFESCQDL